MAVPVILNFDTSYSVEKATDDLKNGFFTTDLQEGGKELLKIEISKNPHELMPGVYNLGFGPVTEDGRINDKAELPHRDYSKVFSTILFVGYRYMAKNPDHMLGIDGSDNRRAVLYFRMLQRNYDYLDNYFEIFGLKYYVRMTRFGKRQYDNPFDFADVLPSPEKIIKNMRIRLEWLYNYFIFKLK
ncbi:MAG TPA: hypothetical protein VG101_01490 [Puia sp.]|jgi:hypothetical protein|nr:hypothetical protein [Puia sp.]